MLIDPENVEEHEQVIWASDMDEARAKCQAIAEEEELTELMQVTQLTQRPSKRGQYKFICWFRSEAD